MKTVKSIKVVNTIKDNKTVKTIKKVKSNKSIFMIEFGCKLMGHIEKRPHLVVSFKPIFLKFQTVPGI